MIYDLPLVSELCTELGISVISLSSDTLEIEIFKDANLVFQNIDNCTDSLIGFIDTPWHSHGGIMFSGANGRFIEMDYLDIPIEIKKGKVLVCEIHNHGVLKDRYLVHKALVDEFEYMEAGDEVRIRQFA